MDYLVTFSSGRFIQVRAEDLDEATSAAFDAYFDKFNEHPDNELVTSVEPQGAD